MARQHTTSTGGLHQQGLANPQRTRHVGPKRPTPQAQLSSTSCGQVLATAKQQHLRAHCRTTIQRLHHYNNNPRCGPQVPGSSNNTCWGWAAIHGRTTPLRCHNMGDRMGCRIGQTWFPVHPGATWWRPGLANVVAGDPMQPVNKPMQTSDMSSFSRPAGHRRMPLHLGSVTNTISSHTFPNATCGISTGSPETR